MSRLFCFQSRCNDEEEQPRSQTADPIGRGHRSVVDNTSYHQGYDRRYQEPRHPTSTAAPNRPVRSSPPDRGPPTIPHTFYRPSEPLPSTYKSTHPLSIPHPDFTPPTITNNPPTGHPLRPSPTTWSPPPPQYGEDFDQYSDDHFPFDQSSPPTRTPQREHSPYQQPAARPRSRPSTPAPLPSAFSAPSTNPDLLSAFFSPNASTNPHNASRLYPDHSAETFASDTTHFSPLPSPSPPKPAPFLHQQPKHNTPPQATPSRTSPKPTLFPPASPPTHRPQTSRPMFSNPGRAHTPPIRPAPPATFQPASFPPAGQALQQGPRMKHTPAQAPASALPTLSPTALKAAGHHEAAGTRSHDGRLDTGIRSKRQRQSDELHSKSDQQHSALNRATLRTGPITSPKPHLGGSPPAWPATTTRPLSTPPTLLPYPSSPSHQSLTSHQHQFPAPPSGFPPTSLPRTSLSPTSLPTTTLSTSLNSLSLKHKPWPEPSAPPLPPDIPLPLPFPALNQQHTLPTTPPRVNWLPLPPNSAAPANQLQISTEPPQADNQLPSFEAWASTASPSTHGTTSSTGGLPVTTNPASRTSAQPRSSSTRGLPLTTNPTGHINTQAASAMCYSTGGLLFATASSSHSVSPQLASHMQCDHCSSPQPTSPMRCGSCEDYQLCRICWDRDRTVAFRPCGHIAACEECAEKILRKRGTCAICMVQIQSIETGLRLP